MNAQTFEVLSLFFLNTNKDTFLYNVYLKLIFTHKLETAIHNN